MFNRFAQFLLVVITVGVDQLLKYFFRYMPIGHENEKGDNTTLFLFDTLCNQGIAFGIKFNRVLIIFFTFFIIVLLLYLAEKVPRKWQDRVAIYLLVAGALSNLIDRIFLGCVVDYLTIPYWPSFNLADALIVCTVGYFVIQGWTKRKLV